MYAKTHLLVDERGAPLALEITGASQHDKWSVARLVVHIVVRRPGGEQHFLADKGYDYADVHETIARAGYHKLTKHRRRRDEPKTETCPVPGETQYPARRWVVKRTFAWLVKRRSIRTRWCKKASNWLAFVQFACASILCDMAVFG